MARNIPILLAICLAFAPVICKGQPGADTVVINRLIRHTEKVLNPDSAIVLFDSAYRMSVRIDFADGAFKALITKGIKYFEKQDYGRYRSVTYDAMKWSDRYSQPDAVAWCLANIGEAWFSEGDYITANEFYYRALEDLNRKTKKITHTTANIYDCLGHVNMRLNQYERALSYHRMAYNVSETADLSYQLAQACEGIGMYHILMNSPDSAAHYFRQEMEIGRKMAKVDLVAFANAKLGKVYIMKGEYARAIDALNTTMSLARNRFNPPVVDAAYSLAQAFRLTHHYKEAEDMLQWAYAETRSHNYRDYYEKAYRELADLSRDKGQYEQAIAYMDSLLLIKDSLTSSDKARAINHLEIRYKTSEKDLKLAESKLLIEKQENTLARKNILMWTITGGVLLLVVLFVVLYFNTRNKQRLQGEQIRTLQQENTIGVLNARVEGEEKERGRIARELHDGIGGMLSAAMMRLSTIPRQASMKEVPAYGEAMQLLNEMGEEIRKTSHNLMPAALLKQDLASAIQGLCDTLMADGSLSISYQRYGDHNAITQDVKLNVYRIVQELLKNIVQHAHASRVLVQTELHERHLNITVEDNGTGFDTAQKEHGLGLYNLAARVRALDGTHTIDSSPGKGTTVNIELDLPNDTQ